MSMDASEIRSKKAAIRQEIKERMQNEFDRRKKEIKGRIKKEKISVEEKREKYRHAVHEEKLALIETARKEFKARKRMLGLTPELERMAEQHKEPFDEPPPIPPWALKDDHPRHEDELLEEEDDFLERSVKTPRDDAFIYEDDEDSDAREFAKPIDEADALPPVSDLPPGDAVFVGPEPKVVEKKVEAKSLFYYIIHLVIHPVQTLEQFDDYLNAPYGLLKLALFYFASLLPIILVALISEDIAEYLPHGLLGTAISSAITQQPNALILVGKTLGNLLIFSSSIAIVNYFVAGQSSFLTLTVYFGFVEGVTRLAIYTLVILLMLAAVFVHALLGVVAVLFIAFFFWTLALNIIVLMSAYDYGFLGATALSFGASVVRAIAVAVIASELGPLLGF